MTPKELLIREIEQVPNPVIEELLDFLLLAKMKYHRQQRQATPFSEFIEELTADIPPQILDTLPTDGAVEHNHYIYGTPKKGLQQT
ncbi:MAG: hypothetical protein AAF215_07885 [Cyanobacteria bacterium P01_A01_bin.123]